jgi:hypothetical protein
MVIERAHTESSPSEPWYMDSGRRSEAIASLGDWEKSKMKREHEKRLGPTKINSQLVTPQSPLRVNAIGPRVVGPRLPAQCSVFMHSRVMSNVYNNDGFTKFSPPLIPCKEVVVGPSVVSPKVWIYIKYS